MALEADARENIDRLLAQGWHMCDANKATIHKRDIRKKRWEQLDNDFSYDSNQIDRNVENPFGCSLIGAQRWPGGYLQ